MNESQLLAYLALSFVPKLGAKSLSKLLAKDSPTNLIQYDQSSLLAIGLTEAQTHYLLNTAISEAATCLEWQSGDSHHHILSLLDSNYPPLLKEIPSPPPVLFVKGMVECLSQPQIAMVGSRNATSDGLNNARSFAQDFVRHDLVVTSGLALGIDGYAHDGALKGKGQTVAVLGSGLNQIYPARHKDLSERVCESGALVSEFRPTTKPRPDHFPRRNRIISGLSVGVLVVEAAEKSGSLITARYAAEQGRDVFAIPGSIHTATSRGGNVLIKNGACLVQNSQDVLTEIETLIKWSISNKPSQQATLFEPSSNKANKQLKEQLPFPELFANVGNEATPVDILASRTHIPVHEVMMQLLELELLGHVVAVSGGYIRKRRG